MDGTSQLEHKKIKKVGKGFTLDLSGKKVLDEERILEVRLNRNGADPVYFYTRIVSDEDAHVTDPITGVWQLSDWRKIQGKQNA